MDSPHPVSRPRFLGLSGYQWTVLFAAWLGWGLGGIGFGHVADRIGRTKNLLFIMLLYSLGTAACALVPDVGFLVLFRFVAALGIGGQCKQTKYQNCCYELETQHEMPPIST